MALPRCIRQLGLLSEIEKDEWLKPYMFRRLGSPGQVASMVHLTAFSLARRWMNSHCVLLWRVERELWSPLMRT